MENFWTNVLRYPRFLISSFIGLILVILTPFKKLFKIPKLRIIFILILLLALALLYFILLSMVGIQ